MVPRRMAAITQIQAFPVEQAISVRSCLEVLKTTLKATLDPPIYPLALIQLPGAANPDHMRSLLPDVDPDDGKLFSASLPLRLHFLEAVGLILLRDHPTGGQQPTHTVCGG